MRVAEIEHIQDLLDEFSLNENQHIATLLGQLWGDGEEEEEDLDDFDE